MNAMREIEWPDLEQGPCSRLMGEEGAEPGGILVARTWRLRSDPGNVDLIEMELAAITSLVVAASKANGYRVAYRLTFQGAEVEATKGNHTFGWPAMPAMSKGRVRLFIDPRLQPPAIPPWTEEGGDSVPYLLFGKEGRPSLGPPATP